MKALSIVALSSLLVMACSHSEKEKIETQNEEAMYMKEDENVPEATREETNWDQVDVTSPIVKYEEIRSDEIEVRATDEISVYTMDEKVLFDFDKATIREGAEEKLEEVIASVEKRHPNAEIAVRGYTDSIGSKGYNKDLAEERAQAVADYLQENADLDRDQIDVLAKGEKDPAATNQTAEGRQKNRRVEILVRG